MNGDERPVPEHVAALARLARDAVRPPTSAELGEGLGAVRARMRPERAQAQRVRRWTFAVAALVACVALGVLVVPRLHPRAPESAAPVSVRRIDGGQLLEGGYLSEVGKGGVRLYFNEGSEFALTPGTRGRLGAVGANGARMVLDHGTASFRITPNAERRWAVEAGPFVVTVRGTDFTVEWDPTGEELGVRLRRGRVAVSGPIVGDELVLRPGQVLTVNLPKRETRISESNDERTVEPSATPASPDASAAAVPSARARAASVASAAAPAGSGGRHWREALASGKWDLILAEAERGGIDATIKTLSSDELFALADAARYRRRPEIARAALLAERERFPRSPRALDAVFLLGRVEELRAGGKAKALTWYDEYLARAPGGTYAAEALGRKMILVKETVGAERARQIAAEYLERFPSGSYAEAARSLEQSH